MTGEAVKQRWKDYFELLYNDPNVTDRNILELPKNSDGLTPRILLEEDRVAVDKLKKNMEYFA